MTYFDPSTYRSPETKSEVKAAARILFSLAGFFVLGALLGLILLTKTADKILLGGILGFVSLLCAAAGSYNVYYTRRMRHAGLVDLALARPNITVIVILIAIILGTVVLAFLISFLPR
jgi:hypothetical protein